MAPQPYRSSLRNADGETAASGGNDDLSPALWCFWGITVVRLIAGLVRHEELGTELTAALLVVLFTPWLLRESFRLRR